jgi:DNA-directed RNA polymerase sigma subunit (sigma70/sigma32)
MDAVQIVPSTRKSQRSKRRQAALNKKRSFDSIAAEMGTSSETTRLIYLGAIEKLRNNPDLKNLNVHKRHDFY